MSHRVTATFIAEHRSAAPVPTRPSAPMMMARGRSLAGSSAFSASSSACRLPYFDTGPQMPPICWAAQHLSEIAAPAKPAQ